MADPFPPTEARERRIGAWVSGVAHAALIGWVAVGGALFRPPQAPALRMSPVETMSTAEFESMAAAARGSGPIGTEAAVTPAQPRPPSAEVIAGGPVAMAPPVPNADPQALPAPEFAGEAAPNLSDLQVPQTPVAVATVAPMPQQPPQAQDEAPPPAALDLPPELPRVAAAPPLTSPAAEAAAPAALPPPPVLMTSDAPFDVAAARQRRAERIAAAEAARAEAEAQAQAQAAEAARQEAARQEAIRQAEAEAQRQAQEALETERLAAEQARIAAEAAARQQAERAAAEAAAAEAARAQAEAQAAAEAERQAALEAEQQERRAAEARERAAAAARRAEQQRLAEEARRVEERRLAEEREAAEARRRAEEEAAAAEAAEALARAEEEAARARAEAQAREEAEAARQAPEDADPLMAALNEALDLPGAVEDGGGGGRAALGPPLSQGEKDGLRLQIESCWNIGSLSREAQRTAVSVQFSMSADGMPEADSVRMIGFDGGSDAAAAQAFEAARRAILRCALQGGGFNLPAEKYGRWRDTIIDFRPQGGPSIR